MSSTMTMMQIAAHITPQEMIIEKIQDAINDYKSAVLDSEKKSAVNELTAICSLQLLKRSGEGKDLIEILKESDRVERVATLLDPLDKRAGN